MSLLRVRHGSLLLLVTHNCLIVECYRMSTPSIVTTQHVVSVKWIFVKVTDWPGLATREKGQVWYGMELSEILGVLSWSWEWGSKEERVFEARQKCLQRGGIVNVKCYRQVYHLFKWNTAKWSLDLPNDYQVFFWGGGGRVAVSLECYQTANH